MSPTSFLNEASVMKNVRHKHLVQVNFIASVCHTIHRPFCKHRLRLLFSVHYIPSFQSVSPYEKSNK